MSLTLTCHKATPALTNPRTGQTDSWFVWNPFRKKNVVDSPFQLEKTTWFLKHQQLVFGVCRPLLAFTAIFLLVTCILVNHEVHFFLLHVRVVVCVFGCLICLVTCFAFLFFSVIYDWFVVQLFLYLIVWIICWVVSNLDSGMMCFGRIPTRLDRGINCHVSRTNRYAAPNSLVLHIKLHWNSLSI